MKKNDYTTLKTDVLIIGSGLAGMLLALKLAENTKLSIAIACKGGLIDSNTAFAQGGLAAVTPSNIFDSPLAHLKDTTASGAGLTDESIARMIIDNGDKLIRELTEQGTRFDGNGNGHFELALEGGHSQARVLHSKDTTGRAIATSLARSLEKHREERPDRLSIFTDTFAISLLESDGRCTGALLDIKGVRAALYARHIVLATGGVGQIFARTTNPQVATGDGIALAYRVGARLADLEFVQFHPTALCKEGAPPFLISEAVRGAGAKLLDSKGRQFAKRFHPDGELATRDVVARAIQTVMREQETANVYLDLRHLGAKKIVDHFPNIVDNVKRFGIDATTDLIPVCPAAHYFMGGIWTDAHGRTTVPALYAIGECASSGLHGANRLASNSLLEAGVMALRVAEYIQTICQLPASQSLSAKQEMTPLSVPRDLGLLRQSMYSLCGLVRSEAGLIQLLDVIESQSHQADSAALSREELVAANILLLDSLIAKAALQRRESRGSHFREDYRLVDDQNFLKRQYVSKQGWGWISLGEAALPIVPQPALTA